MVRRSDSDNVSEYWTRLCPELNNAQAEAAVQALAFNDIDLATCKGCGICATECPQRAITMVGEGA